MSKEWFIKEGGQVCFKSDNAELNGWDIQSLVDCLNGKEIKITELEAKLAESEADKKALICDYESRITKHQELMSWLEHDNEQLKQQLEEKEKKIEKLKTTNDRLYKKNKKLENQIVESNIRFYKKGGVEQLDKVKQYVKNNSMLMNAESLEGDDLGENYLNYFMFVDNVFNKIDNQIKQLKEGK